MDHFLLVKAYNNMKVSAYQDHTEAKEYSGCEYQLDLYHFIQRTAKITPKKVGQFVTLWKRDKQGETVPFSDKDLLDFVAILCFQNKRIGHFLFPKDILLKKKIISNSAKATDGKRGFRVYPKWDIPKSKLATSTQAWQLEYFYEGLKYEL